MHSYRNLVISKWAGALFCALALTQSVNAQTVRLHGAVALTKTIESQRAAIESRSGVKLEVVGNGAGRGLADLSGGQADIALLAGPLQGVADAMNKEKPGSVDAAPMKVIPLMTGKSVIFANPAVGVKSLTDAQVSAVFTGKAANWKEVGGADIPIKVVLPFGGDGSRILLQNLFFPGSEYAKTAIIRSSARDLCVVVAQLPGACSISGMANLEGNVMALTTEKEILVPWSLVVKGEPGGDVKKVIDAATALVK